MTVHLNINVKISKLHFGATCTIIQVYVTIIQVYVKNLRSK